VGAIGNPLVVVMTASPPQVFGSVTPNLNLTVTFYNFATTAITLPQLNPTAPLYFLTGTATLTPIVPCIGPSSPSIPGYSGSGTPPSISFVCEYIVHTGTVGGVVTFEGGGQGIYNGTAIYSAEASSNIVQIGGLTNAIVYGAFSINFFEFKFTSCTNAPTLNGSGSIFNEYPVSYSAPCTTNAVLPSAHWTALPDASDLSAGGNHYVAFYIEVTNNFNSSLTIMPYTMMQLDASDGGESDWWLAGNANSLSGGVYYPNYNPGGNNLPTLAAYPGGATCASTSPPSGCFDLGPGQSQVLTLAACSYGSANWDWGGVPDADHFDVKSGCISSWPLWGGVYGHGSANDATLVISFYYYNPSTMKGFTYTQDIGFEGVALVP